VGRLDACQAEIVSLWWNRVGVGSGAAAAFLVVAAQGLFALTDSFAPFVADDMSIWQFQAVRAALMLPVAFAGAAALGSWQRILPKRAGAVALRTVLNVLALGAYFAVLPLVPFGQAAAGFFTTPIWVAICLSLTGGATADRRMWVTVGLGFTGAALAVGVGGTMEAVALVPVVAGGVNALSIVVTNRHCRDEDACALLFWSIFGFLGLGLAGVAAAVWLGAAGTAAGMPGVLFVQPSPIEAKMLLVSAALGLSSIMGAGLLMRGYQIGENASIALFDYSYLIWAAVVSAALWGQSPTVTGLAGLILILLAGVVAIAPRRQARGEEKRVAAPVC
jgi:drug/metabolite transporter (DMT)-like permease